MAQISQRPIKDNPYPYADTQAALVLRSGLEHVKRSRGLSLRRAAAELNYKQATVLSHMANGRTPVPLERAEAIADFIGVDRREFKTMVLKQRYPGYADPALMDGAMLLAPGIEQGDPADPAQKRVIREVLRDKQAAERWLSPHAVGVMRLLRSLRPKIDSDGLSNADMERIAQCLRD